MSCVCVRAVCHVCACECCVSVSACVMCVLCVSVHRMGSASKMCLCFPAPGTWSFCDTQDFVSWKDLPPCGPQPTYSLPAPSRRAAWAAGSVPQPEPAPVKGQAQMASSDREGKGSMSTPSPWPGCPQGPGPGERGAGNYYTEGLLGSPAHTSNSLESDPVTGSTAPPPRALGCPP